MTAWKRLVGGLLALALTACAPLTGKLPGPAPEGPAPFPGAETLIRRLEEQNAALESFKGQGTFALWHEGVLTRERLAYAGRYPDKLRVAVRGIAGMPIATLATDGEHIYFLAHHDQRFFKRRTDDPSLERILRMPVRARDIIALLSGRIPLPDHHSAWVTPDPAGDGYILVLKHGWLGQAHHRIHFDGEGGVPKLEVYDRTGSLDYRVDFLETAKVDGFEVPVSLFITNDRGTRFQLDTGLYRPNTPVSPSLFVLAPRS